MQKGDIKRFYGDIAGDKYIKEIRRFGLRYDEMVDTLVNILTINQPKDILDIGCGVGNIEEDVLRKLLNAKIICVDLSPEMITFTKQRLKNYNTEIICEDILRFKPKNKFDVIFSNLMMHNLPLNKKMILLKKIKTWLNPKGVFIWGDFMQWNDKEIEKHFMDYRKRVVLESGASKKLVEEIFTKESKDPRLTVEQTISLLKNTGFKKHEVIWVYSFLAIFYAKV